MRFEEIRRMRQLIENDYPYPDIGQVVRFPSISYSPELDFYDDKAIVESKCETIEWTFDGVDWDMSEIIIRHREPIRLIWNIHYIEEEPYFRVTAILYIVDLAIQAQSRNIPVAALEHDMSCVDITIDDMLSEMCDTAMREGRVACRLSVKEYIDEYTNRVSR